MWRSVLVDVAEVQNGAERTLRLWRKSKSEADRDIHALWRHEVRHVQRVMSYADAREVFVEAIEFTEDDSYFAIVLARSGKPIAELRESAAPGYWLRRLTEPGSRKLFWMNIQRLVTAIGILHAQGLVHGNIGPDVVMTHGFDEADFRLTGFEWSLWLGASAEGASAVGSSAALVYSFEGDWRSLGHLIAWTMGVTLTAAGDVVQSQTYHDAVVATHAETSLIRRLVAPTPAELVDAHSLSRAIDDILEALKRARTSGAAAFLILTFSTWDKIGDAIYEATNGEITTEDTNAQMQWVQSDIDAGATLLVPRRGPEERSRMRLVTANFVYELAAFANKHTGLTSWEVAVCRDVRSLTNGPGVTNYDEHRLSQQVEVVRRFKDASDMRARRAADVVSWGDIGSPGEPPGLNRSADVRRALLLIQTLEALVRTLENYPVEIVRTDRDQVILIRAQEGSDRDEFSRKIGLGETGEVLLRLFDDEQRDATLGWRLSKSASLGSPTSRDVAVHFITVSGSGLLQFRAERSLSVGDHYFLRADRELGTAQAIRRRLRNIAALESRLDLERSLHEPWRERRRSPEQPDLADEAFAELDKPKQLALRAVFETSPTFLVVGPPGVGKTKLATEVVRRRLLAEPASRILVSSQGHDSLDHLQQEIKTMLARAGMSNILVVRSRPPEGRSSTEDDIYVVVRMLLDRIVNSELLGNSPPPLISRTSAQLERFRQDPALKKLEAEDFAFASLVGEAAHIFLSTTNSHDIERLVESREQFDWVLIEEAAKATGPELVGPLLLSGKRLLIGDHHQLAPMEAKRIDTILRDPSLVTNALGLAKRTVAPIFADATELDELIAYLAEPAALNSTLTQAWSLLEPFRAFVERDKALASASPTPRRISATLTEQRRMDPAIARVVSGAFYNGELTTESGRAERAVTEVLPYDVLGRMVRSPIVVVDHPHVSSSGKSAAAERDRPRWHNLQEIESVIDVLRCVRPRSDGGAPSLAVLSPYNAQVDKLRARLQHLLKGPLLHVKNFATARVGGEFVGTVDSFQGSEADLVVLSLVRNNARVGFGALGFLRDWRRMNVALSRAKKQLVLVGSLSFLEEAVRGVSPRKDDPELSFLASITGTLRVMSTERRPDGVPLVSILAHHELRRPV